MNVASLTSETTSKDRAYVLSASVVINEHKIDVPFRLGSSGPSLKCAIDAASLQCVLHYSRMKTHVTNQLIVSPEKFCTAEIRGVLENLNNRDQLNRLVVDEVRCRDRVFSIVYTAQCFVNYEGTLYLRKPHGFRSELCI